MDYLRQLESESIYIIRETYAEFKNPFLLYSIGKDSSVLLHLIRKALDPVNIPIPLLHIDTGYKFKEMIEFRNYFADKIGARLIIERNEQKILEKIHPSRIGTDLCCSFLKTQALLDALKKYDVDAAFGGARRDEEKSRAKERIYSLRNEFGMWDPHNQRAELWSLYNPHLPEGASMRVFPLSNWTEVDIWHYIEHERIEIVPLYFAEVRNVVIRNNVLIPVDDHTYLRKDEKVMRMKCRFRSLGCSPCTGVIASEASSIPEIIEELLKAKQSERENRVIDLNSESSMEQKKRQGYF